MKEFLQGALVSLAIMFPIYLMSNGFALSPKSASAPAMDPNMPGMNHGTAPATTPVQDESMPHSH